MLQHIIRLINLPSSVTDLLQSFHIIKILEVEFHTPGEWNNVRISAPGGAVVQATGLQMILVALK